MQKRNAKYLGVYYYTNPRGLCEIDFGIDTGEQIIPVEVLPLYAVENIGNYM